jgi:hypothetical protein
MPVTINGDGSIAGLSVGGLGSGVVNTATLASNAITSAIQPAGSVIQVNQTVKTDTFSTTSFTNTWVDIGPQGSITAIKAGNKIMVEIMLSVGCTDGRHISFRLEKDGSVVAGARGDSRGSNRKRGCFHMYQDDQNGQHDQHNYFIKYLDTAADTNAHTYNIAVTQWNGQGSTEITCNRSKADGDQDYESTTISTVTLTEIAA